MRRLAAALALACGLALLGPVAAPAVAGRPGGCSADDSGTLEVCVTAPFSRGGPDRRVVDRFVDVFDAAGAGDTLRIAMFRWDIAATTTALLGASRRGARVELVADRDVTTVPAGRRLVAGLRAAGQPVTVCRGACLPWAGRGPAPPSQDINHLKLLLADVGGRQSVITSSSNFEGRQYDQVNSLLSITDPAYYAWASAYVDRIAARSWTIDGATWGPRRRTFAGPGLTAAVYPRPRGDLVLDTLRTTRCVPGARSVDVMVAVLQRSDVRAQLGRLARSGCRVRIVTTRDLIENWLQRPFRLPGGAVADLPDRRVRTILTHDKVYAVHARVGGTVRRVVLTGTSNTTCGGLLYNDELMVRLEGRWAYDTYRAHVLDAYRHAHQARVPTVPAQAPCR